MVFPKRIFGPLNSPYYVYAPDYRDTSGGVRILHYLCHALNLMGEEAYVTTRVVNPRLRTPYLTEEIRTEHQLAGREPIVIYPEVTYGNPMNATLAVRFFLNSPGKLTGKMGYGDDEMLIAQAGDVIPPGWKMHILTVPHSDQSIFNNENNDDTLRKGTCFFVHRYVQQGYALLEVTKDSIEISPRVPHRSLEELAALLRRSELLYAYEPSTLCYEALLCGCPVVYLPNDYMTRLPGEHLGSDGVAWGNTPEAVSQAKSTVHLAAHKYQQICDDFWPQLAQFIEMTQSWAKEKSSAKRLPVAAASTSSVPAVEANLDVSVIICSINDNKYKKIEANYKTLLQGIKHEIIRISDARSLCEGYNRGVARAQGNILVFSHDDIEILSPDFWPRLQAHLQSFDLIGIAGTSLLAGPLWGQVGLPFLHGTVIHRREDDLMINMFDNADRRSVIGNIQAVDGLFFAVRRSLVQTLRFDEETFDGFHFYDLDFSYAAYLAGFKLGVCNDLAIIHDSQGDYDETWEKYACLFMNKYKNHFIPMKARPSSLPAVIVKESSEAYILIEAMAGNEQALSALVNYRKVDNLPYPERYYAYQTWREKRAISEVDAEIWASRMTLRWKKKPIIQILIWLVPGEETLLADTLDSIGIQLYSEWRLTVVSPMPAPDRLWTEVSQLRWLQSTSDEYVDSLNNASTESRADWIAFIPPGTKLEPHALLSVADYINANPRWQLLYSDEDRMMEGGDCFDPHFKPEFDPDLLLSMPYMGEAVFISCALAKRLGGYRSFPGWENYWISLLASVELKSDEIGHIADVLMHFPRHRQNWPQDERIGLHALRVFLEEKKIPAIAEQGLAKGIFRAHYQYPGEPLVSIIIPTRDKLEYLRPCVDSILEKTNYKNYEILICDNQSKEPETLSWLGRIQNTSDGRVRVFTYDAAFNFSAICNTLARHAGGEYLLFLNNDTQILHGGWLDSMLSIGKRPEVGVVGCRLIYQEGGGIQHAGIVLGYNDVAGHVYGGIGNVKYPGYMQRALCEQNYSAVTAAAMLVRRALYETVGGMDDKALPVLYGDVDFCLKVRNKGFRVIYTPHATLIHHGSQTLKSLQTEEHAALLGDAIARKQRERKVFWDRWNRQIQCDPYWNINLSLRGKEVQVEGILAPGWDRNFRDRPRIVGVPLTGGAGEYRVISPLRGLRNAGRAQVTLASNNRMFRTRIISECELARLDPDSILLHAPIDDEQLKSIETFQRYLPDVLRIATFDDLLTAVPEKNNFKRFGFRDVERRLRLAMEKMDRCIVTTQPLRDWCEQFGARDVRVVPNTLESPQWQHAVSKRRVGSKPRVGWAGAQQHLGDLESMTYVLSSLANEVEWVFMGMCPDSLRQYVHEFHDFERNFDHYPAKLAGLNLDLSIAPLEIHPFNEAKSNLRLLEYGIMGWPVVCTDIYPYQNAPVKRIPNNDPQAWIEAIRERIYDLDSAEKEGDALKAWVRHNYMLENHLDAWLSALSR